MLRAGISAPLVFCAIAAMNVGRFALRPLVLPLARRFGVKPLLIAGTALEALVYVLLPNLHGPGGWLLLVIAVGSVGGVFYWTSYHAYYAAFGDGGARGAEIGARQAIMGIVNVAAPAIGGLALARAGPTIAFGLAALMQATALAPLLGVPSLSVAPEPRVGHGDYLWGALLQSTDGWMDAGFFYVWQVALFVRLGERFASYGGAMAIAGLLGAAASLTVGRLIDLGHGRAGTLLAYGLTGGSIVLQAASVGRPGWAVIANAFSAFAIALYAPGMMTRVYALGKASPCPLRFHIATEGGWDIGSGLGCLICAALIAGGASLSAAILTALLGASAAAAMLARDYGAPARSGRSPG